MTRQACGCRSSCGGGTRRRRGPSGCGWLSEFRDAGVSRVMASVFEAVSSDDALGRLVDDVVAAGLTLR